MTVRNQDTGMFRETVSNADGTYFVAGVVPGVYEITAELQAFRKYSRKDVRLEVGKTTTIDIELAVGSLEEVVAVTAESPIVDITSKEVGGTVTARELVELPSVNRNFVGFVGLLPGIIPSISTESFGSDSITVNGQDPRNNNYMLDGAQQQRRRHRPARGDAGADADRSGGGVPGHHQPVRRRVRAYGRRHRQRRDQAGLERVSRQRASCSVRTPA